MTVSHLLMGTGLGASKTEQNVRAHVPNNYIFLDRLLKPNNISCRNRFPNAPESVSVHINRNV